MIFVFVDLSASVEEFDESALDILHDENSAVHVAQSRPEFSGVSAKYVPRHKAVVHG